MELYQFAFTSLTSTLSSSSSLSSSLSSLFSSSPPLLLYQYHCKKCHFLSPGSYLGSRLTPGQVSSVGTPSTCSLHDCLQYLLRCSEWKPMIISSASPSIWSEAAPAHRPHPGTPAAPAASPRKCSLLPCSDTERYRVKMIRPDWTGQSTTY